MGGLFVRTDRLEEVGTEIFVDLVKPGWKRQLTLNEGLDEFGRLIQMLGTNEPLSPAPAPPLTVRMIKRAIYQGMRNDLRTNLDLISSHYAVVTASEGHREAVRQFSVWLIRFPLISCPR